MSERHADTVKTVTKIIVPELEGELCGIIRTEDGTEYKVWAERRFGGEKWDPDVSVRALRDTIEAHRIGGKDLWLRDPIFGHLYALLPRALEMVTQVATAFMPIQNNKPVRTHADSGIEIVRGDGFTPRR